jgi:hypothetical protein
MIWEDWWAREVERGIESSPKPSEFINTHEFDLTRQDWGARGINYLGEDSSNQVLMSRTLFSHPSIRGSRLLDCAQGGNASG